MVEIGTLPSGGACKINAVAAQADLLIAEGFIESHFFAGFSGSRKSVLPGIASYETIMYNRDGAFARAGGRAPACSRAFRASRRRRAFTTFALGIAF